MFCPKCSSPNEVKQGYCRQCGQPLAAVQLALTGHADEALASLKKARKSLNYGLTILGMFMLMVLVTFLLGGVVPYVVLALGFVLSVPSIAKGIMQLRRAANLLDVPEEPGSSDLKQHERATANLRAADSEDSTLRLPNSVTEHTTLELKTFEPRPGAKSN